MEVEYIKYDGIPNGQRRYTPGSKGQNTLYEASRHQYEGTWGTLEYSEKDNSKQMHESAYVVQRGLGAFPFKIPTLNEKDAEMIKNLPRGGLVPEIVQFGEETSEGVFPENEYKKSKLIKEYNNQVVNNHYITNNPPVNINADLQAQNNESHKNQIIQLQNEFKNYLESQGKPSGNIEKDVVMQESTPQNNIVNVTNVDNSKKKLIHKKIIKVKIDKSNINNLYNQNNYNNNHFNENNFNTTSNQNNTYFTQNNANLHMNSINEPSNMEYYSRNQIGGIPSMQIEDISTPTQKTITNDEKKLIEAKKDKLAIENKPVQKAIKFQEKKMINDVERNIFLKGSSRKKIMYKKEPIMIEDATRDKRKADSQEGSSRKKIMYKKEPLMIEDVTRDKRKADSQVETRNKKTKVSEKNYDLDYILEKHRNIRAVYKLEKKLEDLENYKPKNIDEEKLLLKQIKITKARLNKK